MTYAIMHDPSTDGQHIQLIGAHTDRLIFGDYYVFDARGNFQGNTGISDGSIGQQIAGSVYNVHFANWGGTPIKIAYGIFGLTLCTITCSGLSMDFQSGRRRAVLHRGLRAAGKAIVAASLLGVVLFKVEQDGKAFAEPASSALKHAE